MIMLTENNSTYHYDINADLKTTLLVYFVIAIDTAVPSLHFSSARGPARGAVVTRSHNPGSDVPAAVSVTQKNTFSWVRKKNHKKSESDVYVF